MVSKNKTQIENGLAHARKLQNQLLEMDSHIQKGNEILRTVQENAAEFLHTFEGPAYLKSRLQRFLSISNKLLEQEKQQSVLHSSLRRQLEKFLDPDLLMYYSPAVSRRLISAFGSRSEYSPVAPRPDEHRCFRLGDFFFVTRAEPLMRISSARLRKTGQKLPRRVRTTEHGTLSLFPGHPDHYHSDGPSSLIVLQGEKKLGVWVDEELTPINIEPYVEEMEVSRRAPYPVRGRFRKRGQQYYLLEP